MWESKTLDVRMSLGRILRKRLLWAALGWERVSFSRWEGMK